MPNIVPFKKEHLDKINLVFEMSGAGKESLGSYEGVIGYTGMEGDGAGYRRCIQVGRRR